MEAAGVPRARLSGAEKVKAARLLKAAKTTKSCQTGSAEGGATEPLKPQETPQGQGGEVLRTEEPRPQKSKAKKKKALPDSSARTGAEPIVAAEASPVPDVGLSSAGQPSMAPEVPSPVEVSSSATEEVVPLKRKQKEPSPVPAETKRQKTAEEGPSCGGLGSALIPFATTGFEGADLKTLMEMLFAFHAQGNAVLLRVSDEQKVLERNLNKSLEECAEAKQGYQKIRQQLLAQHDSFHIMRTQCENMTKEKVMKDKETKRLKDELKAAQEKGAKYKALAEDASKRAEEELSKGEAEKQNRLILENKLQELELQVQKQKELSDQSEGIIKLQTEQMKNLKNNVEMIVEGWSTKEADWMKGPILSASPSVLAAGLRKQVIEEYKASDEFHQDIQDSVVNEFNDGFEFARELVRGKGHDPDALGIVIPED